MALWYTLKSYGEECFAKENESGRSVGVVTPTREIKRGAENTGRIVLRQRSRG